MGRPVAASRLLPATQASAAVSSHSSGGVGACRGGTNANTGHVYD